MSELAENRLYGPAESGEKAFYDEQTKQFRERTGAVESESGMVTFFYQLLRDSMTPGEVEVQIKTALWAHQQGKAVYTNGYLANYAKDIVNRLTNAHKEHKH